MTVKQRHRLWYLITGFLGGGGLILVITIAFQENMVYFVTPTELLAKSQYNRSIRLGGLVEKGSVLKDVSTLTTTFVVTDTSQKVKVFYTGVVPDLFREGQGVIVDGLLDPSGVFQATRLLAKHDENYMPPDLAKKLEK